MKHTLLKRNESQTTFLFGAKVMRDFYRTDKLPNGAITSVGLEPEEVVRLMLDPSYRLYTQVDSDSGAPVYVAGPHVVNRTGVYAWVPIRAKGNR